MCMVSSVAEAQNGGFSLSNMAALNAPFVTSGNDLKYYPDAPFQTLYVISPSTTNTFHVRTGTMIYMPIFNADDSPPILLGPPLGHFPTNHDEAVFYWSRINPNLGSAKPLPSMDGQLIFQLIMWQDR